MKSPASMMFMAFMALTVAGLVSSLPVSQTTASSTQGNEMPGNIPVNMIVLHFPGDAATSTTSNPGSEHPKVQEQQDKSLHLKPNGYTIMSSSKTSNFAVVTPLQARSEVPSVPYEELVMKRAIPLQGGEGEVYKRGLTIAFTPLFRQTSSLVRGYVVKPAGRAFTRVRDQIKENNRQYKLEQRWLNERTRPFEGFHGHEHFYGDRMRYDWMKMPVD